jgi:hypothetical protein
VTFLGQNMPRPKIKTEGCAQVSCIPSDIWGAQVKWRTVKTAGDAREDVTITQLVQRASALAYPLARRAVLGFKYIG